MYKAVKAKVKNIENYDILQLIAEPNLKLDLLRLKGNVSLVSINQLYYGSFKSS